MKTRQNSAKIFNFFASVRLTVVILLTLAATSVMGTIIPQNQELDAYFQIYSPGLCRLFKALDMFDMYHSLWFQLLLLLLVVNIIVCSLDRLPGAWRIVFRSPAFQLSRFQNSPNNRHVDVSFPVNLFQPALETIVRRTIGRFQTVPFQQGICIWGEKGRWTRLGVYIVHLSVVVLLAGGLMGSFWGFDGYVNIPEGETVDSIHLGNFEKMMPMGFEIRCDKFSVHFYESGAPSEYRSTLTILEKGVPVLTRDIIVNDPLRYKGVNLYQSSYGTLSPQKLVLGFTSQASGIEYKENIEPGQTVTIPEGLGTFMITGYDHGHQFMGHDIGDAFVGMLMSPDEKPVEVVLPIRFPAFDKMRKGDVIISVAETENRYYTGIQVTHDPGVWGVYSGFFLMIAGCIITFFMSHRQICIEIRSDGKTSSVDIWGITNKNRFTIQRKMDAIAEAVIHIENRKKKI